MNEIECREYYGSITSDIPDENVTFKTAKDMSDFRLEYILLCRKYRRIYEDSE